MLTFSFFLVAQLFTLLVFNSIRKRLLKKFSWKNVSKLLKMAIKLAFEFASTIFKRQ